MKKLIVPLMLLVSLSTGSAEANIPYTSTPIAEVIANSRHHGRPVLIEFGARWCGACRVFEKSVLSDWQLSEPLKGISYVRYDIDEPAGLEAAERYSVAAFPTFIAIDKNGLERFRRSYAAAETVEKFLAVVADTKSLSDDEETVKARLKQNPKDAETHIAVARWYTTRNQNDRALPLLRAAARLAKSKDTKRAANREYARVRRIGAWKTDVSKNAEASLLADPELATADELTIALVGSTIPDARKRALIKSILKSIPTTDPKIAPLVYVIIAAGYAQEIVASVGEAACETDADRCLAIAEAYFSSGDSRAALRVLDAAITAGAGGPELSAARVRIAKGTEESPEVVRRKMQASDLWRRIDEAESLRQFVPPNRNVMAVVRAAERLGSTIGAKCARQAGAADRLYARVTIDSSQGSITPTQYYAPEALSTELRKCIDLEFSAAKIPVLNVTVAPQYIVILFNSRP